MRWTGLLLLALAAPALAKKPPMPLPPPVPPPPPANCTAPEYRQFDFWIGDWEARTTGQLEEMRGGTTVESVNYGCGLAERWGPFTSIQGRGLFTYDKRDKLWHHTYIDALGSRVEFQGGLKDGRMVLTGLWRGLYRDGRDGLMRMSYWRTREGYVRQVGEVSPDEGKTWEPSYDFTFVPRTP